MDKRCISCGRTLHSDPQLRGHVCMTQAMVDGRLGTVVRRAAALFVKDYPLTQEYATALVEADLVCEDDLRYARNGHGKRRVFQA